VTDIRELLPLYALDALELDGDEAREVEQAVAADPQLAAELVAYRETAHQLAELTPIEPTPDVKTRLFASIGAGRFERFSTRLASLFDVTVERARELLGLVERSASWETPVPGIGLVHFEGGPACAAADCGFIRIAPGCTFPWHTHRGEEVSIILTGSVRDGSGKVLKPGDELVQPLGSQHDLTAEGEEVIFVARAFGGIEVANRP
jgi:putative transcriptional regulator